MSYNKATYAFLALLLLLAAGYGWQALSFEDLRNRNSVGPGYFPLILAVALTILVVISTLQTRARADRRINIPNPWLIVATLVLSASFLLAWAALDLFYLPCFVFVLALFVLYDPRRTFRQLAFKVVLTGAVTGFIYLLFDLLIQVRF